jgi:predicted Fe-Mo cluster-binding NifX family protein
MNMIKIAFPTSDRTTIDGHFGHTKEFVIYEVENNSVLKETYVTPPPHEPGVLPKFLANNGVNTIITGGMGAMAIRLFNTNNVEVVLGASGAISPVLEAYLNGTLQSTGSACSHDHGQHGHGHH